VSHLGCTYNWQNHHSGRKLILHNVPSVIVDDLTVYSLSFRLCEVHLFKIGEQLKLDISQMELNTCETIWVVKISDNRQTIVNPNNIAEPEVNFRVEFSHCICRLKWVDCEVIQSTRLMLIVQCFHLLAKQLSLLIVVCWPKWMP
jgi:hypothetical protein